MVGGNFGSIQLIQLGFQWTPCPLWDTKEGNFYLAVAHCSLKESNMYVCTWFKNVNKRNLFQLRHFRPNAIGCVIACVIFIFDLRSYIINGVKREQENFIILLAISLPLLVGGCSKTLATS